MYQNNKQTHYAKQKEFFLAVFPFPISFAFRLTAQSLVQIIDYLPTDILATLIPPPFGNMSPQLPAGALKFIDVNLRKSPLPSMVFVQQ